MINAETVVLNKQGRPHLSWRPRWMEAVSASESTKMILPTEFANSNVLTLLES
jgi:hypothetical protein